VDPSRASHRYRNGMKRLSAFQIGAKHSRRFALERKVAKAPVGFVRDAGSSILNHAALFPLSSLMTITSFFQRKFVGPDP
jgi:hypothetical protein